MIGVKARTGPFPGSSIGWINEKHGARIIGMITKHLQSIALNKGKTIAKGNDVENTAMKRLWIPPRLHPTSPFTRPDPSCTGRKNAAMVNTIFQYGFKSAFSLRYRHTRENALYIFRAEIERHNRFSQPFTFIPQNSLPNRRNLLIQLHQRDVRSQFLGRHRQANNRSSGKDFKKFNR